MNIPANGIISYKFDVQERCRICRVISTNLNSIFDDNGSGSAFDFASKINEYLPITVRKSDYLPKKICSMCATTLLAFHQLYTTCQINNSRFLETLDGEAYEHHVVKNQVVGDPSELLELQSSFSREIENEILNMHESKEINEAESEIAANAAVKELERIGSAENISLVDDILHPINEDKEEVLHQKKSDKIDQNEDDSVDESPKLRNVEVQSSTRNRSKKEPIPRKRKNEEKPKPSQTKARTVKTPKKVVKNSKAEILKENITRSKSSKIERSPDVVNDDKNVKENSFSKTEKQISPKIACDYCSMEFTTKSLLVDHIKDAHNDLIFHCEMCDDYVARVELISHMLNHALNSNNIIKEQTTEEEVISNEKKSPEKAEVESDASKKPSAKKIATPEKQNDAAPVNGNQKTAKGRARNYCEICDKTFADSGGYRYHIDSFHKKIKKYECDICGNHFSCKRVITNHLRGVHMKARIFECDECKKKFSTDSALYMHKKIHVDEFKYECQVCDRKFRSRSKLKIHMTMHTKEQNYFCEICRRGFAVRNNLTKHMLTHSKLFNFKCDKCTYVANQRRYLAEHIKRSHKND
ncbi:zinc finger protein 354A-like [Contarinia nasturtii]|uniref:zinc finger protein 354A-like n=1 Tax=Contarinia nasturtii TaxID=265458 RepID=UPI0012D39C4F|nr:zinc finger protein 354A-like [Contarinia nasturtii]